MIVILLQAIVQALTEFIPVSSSGHLIIVSELFDEENSIGVDVMLHVGTLLSLLVYFRSRIIELLKATSSEAIRLRSRLAISFIPIIPAGIFVQFVLDDAARTTEVVGVMLIVVGVLFIVADRLLKGEKTVNQISVQSAWKIGFMQVLSLIPGTSRSGITMLAGRSQGLSHKSAAEYAFLLGIPSIGAATGVILLDGESRDYISGNPAEVILGVIVACIVGILAISAVFKLLSRFGLRIFGIYRIALGVAILILLG